MSLSRAITRIGTITLLAVVCHAVIDANFAGGDAIAPGVTVNAIGDETASSPDFERDGAIGFGEFSFRAFPDAQFSAPDAVTGPTPYPYAGDESETGVEYDTPHGPSSEWAAKVALGNNANAVLSLDLIADGGAGNQRDDGVTTGAVQGRGTIIAIEVFATGVTTSLRGVVIRFDFDPSLVTYVKAENSAFGLSIPEGSVGVNLASTTPVTLARSGFLARAEFETAADVTGREFSIGVERVTIAESATSSDDLATRSVITFNAAGSASPDFDGDGTVSLSDFLAFAGSFGSSQGDARYEARFDLDGDGAVALSDFLIFAGAFGSEVPSSGTGGGGATVTIADDNLRAVIADSLGKKRTDPITRGEMATLTRIAAPNMGIRSLSGLQHATNLTTLLLGRARVDGEWVNRNAISDLSPLSRLTDLTILDLTWNRITSVSALSNLTNLTQLHLGGNQTISNISALSNLTMLTRLNLWDNNISEISPLFGMTNLEYLALSTNSISDISALSNLTNLTVLYLYNNGISDINALSNLTNLTELSLGNNSISDISALSKLSNLTELYLYNTRISEISDLSKLTNLTRLSLGRGWVDGEWVNGNDVSDLAPLSRLTDLTYLNFTSNRISSISALSNLRDLTELHLGGNQTISNISALSILTMLKRLNLWDNNISDISPLVANTGLGEGDFVNIRGNPLSSMSLNTHVPALQRRGVEVRTDSGNGGGGGSSGSSPDLIVESPSVDDNTLTTGQSFTLSATVRNQGNASSAATTLRYYRSSNSTISTNDTEVGTDAVSGLSPGGTSAESISLNAPSDAGTYYYGACVDDVSDESNTGNNCSDAVDVTVSGGGGGSGGACRAGLVVNPGGTCTYKGNTFSVSSSGRGSIAFFNAGTGIDARGATINGVRWNFHATKNSGSNSWTIHVAD
ncbi:MAG: leucine-rich repeat domain-containing protein [Gemmatimonadota bacterium]|nr:leucine-rich repeat domain-containing protein [Gemmatimonadota bacterium]